MTSSPNDGVDARGAPQPPTVVTVDRLVLRNVPSADRLARAIPHRLADELAATAENRTNARRYGRVEATIVGEIADRIRRATPVDDAS